ncbi:DUF2255 family protein [Agromyces seonyuensis]|uniref:DUF2255 family protein n=1 Tax=Agromyces seonyuensis TaxID=2662446 RepID=A0A6I4NVI7_9MICO|nr:DUF2255 family protein [Agromyces seonyuensis]MWB97112.1 DUF2255 family protein [Agromyces seonyuensis]
MSTWNPDDLSALERAREVRVAGRRADGTLRPLVTIWDVVVDGAVYVRSARGAEGGWYRGVLAGTGGALEWDGTPRDVVYASDSSADEAVDAAYFAKYGDTSSSRTMIAPGAVATTLRVDPA